MNRSHAQMLRVFTRIRDFLARTPITAQLGDLDGQRKQLDSIITRLTVACDDQRRLTRASRGGTLTAKRLARRVRHTFIRPVVRAAQTMTGLDAVALRALSMPKMESYEQLVSATNEYARLVEQHRDRFVAAGLAPDIAEKMRGAAAEVLAVVNARSADQGQRVASSQGAYAASGAGRRLLRLLSALVESALEEEVALLAEWRSLVRLSGRGSAPADTTPTEVPAGSAPVVEGALQAA